MLAAALRHTHARLAYGSLPRRALSTLLYHLPLAPPTSGVLTIPGKHGYRLEGCHSSILRQLWLAGEDGYEGIMARIWRDECSKAAAVLEIGANIGWFTVVGGLAAPGRYVAIEPVPACFMLATRNVALNNVRAELIQAAVAHGGETIVQLDVPDEQWGITTGAAIAGLQPENRQMRQSISVPAVALEDLIEKYPATDVLKIDAEGIEVDLLESVSEWVVSRRPTLVIELLPRAARLEAFLHQIVRAAEYRIFALPARRAQAPVDITDASDFRSASSSLHARDVMLKQPFSSKAM